MSHLLPFYKLTIDHIVCVCRLQEEYPKWFEKPVLEMVHHNTVSLDKLVEMAWVEILTKYAVGEECDFLVSLTAYSYYISKLVCNVNLMILSVFFFFVT